MKPTKYFTLVYEATATNKLRDTASIDNVSQCNAFCYVHTSFCFSRRDFSTGLEEARIFPFPSFSRTEDSGWRKERSPQGCGEKSSR